MHLELDIMASTFSAAKAALEMQMSVCPSVSQCVITSFLDNKSTKKASNMMVSYSKTLVMMVAATNNPALKAFAAKAPYGACLMDS